MTRSRLTFMFQRRVSRTKFSADWFRKKKEIAPNKKGKARYPQDCTWRNFLEYSCCLCSIGLPICFSLFFLKVVNAYPRPDWPLLINMETGMTDVQLNCRSSLGLLSICDKTFMLYSEINERWLPCSVRRTLLGLVVRKVYIAIHFINWFFHPVDIATDFLKNYPLDI